MRAAVRIVAGCSALAAMLLGALMFWRRNPRIGTRLVNTVVNPALVGHGLAGGRTSEIGMLEHVGRQTGTHRFTPVHPEPTADGFRVVVPLGRKSEWARNVLAAGGCRLQLHDETFELDRPELLDPADVGDLPRVVRRTMSALGFEYLNLRAAA
jgi:deazaflavin-dependent oxidoreductase (nitroreductase family)